MFSSFLDYFLFKYEMAVYPEYTELKDEMIEEKIRHFWKIISSEKGYSVTQMLACFYDRNDRSGKYVHIDQGTVNTESMEFKSKESLGEKLSDIIKTQKTHNGGELICLPYYLFRNDKVDELKENYEENRQNVKSYRFYEDLKKKKTKFIWREPFKIVTEKSAEPWMKQFQDQLNKLEENFKKANGINPEAAPYQKLYCLLVVSGHMIDKVLHDIGESFTLTIKEWGLDILHQEVVRHGVRAAVAAIMGRNMSHNIGSHVLSYLSDECPTPDEYFKDKSHKNKQYVYSLGFYKYLQGRSDFIAEISTARPIWATQMRLIKDIMDPFVYSDSKTQKGELLNNLGRSVYVLQNGELKPLGASKIQINISWVSKNFRLQYMYDDRNQKYNRHKYKYDKTSNRYRRLREPFEDLDDTHIDMPHGLIGCHAFYSILENFLRNSFKHNSGKIIKEILNTKRNFEAYIEIDDNIKQHPDLIRVKLYDNVSDYSKDIKKGFQKYLNGEESQLVNKDGSLKTDGGWGIKEMRISSAWLRNISPEDVQSCNEAPALLSIGNTDSRDRPEEAKKLYYEFYLQKPLLVLLIDRQNDIKKVPSAGIYKACSKEDFIDLGQTGKLRHKFFIINDEETKEWVRVNKNKLPPRIFLVSNDPVNSGGFPSLSEDKYKEVISQIKNNEYDLLEKELNEGWVNYLCDGKMPEIYCVKDSIEHNKLTAVDANSECSHDSIVFQHSLQKGYKDAEVAPVNPLYWEYYSTSSGVNTLGGRMKMIRDVKNDAIKLKTLYELYEVGLAYIVIVDDRLFSKLDYEKEFPGIGKKFKIFELLHRWNMDVIDFGEGTGNDFTVYYRKPDGKTDTKAWSEYINERNVTFLSIHQTIIDKKITEDLFKKVIAGSENIQNVSIHSGRGQVNITPGFKFVGYSNIETFVTDKPDKHQLCSLLMNISSL